MFGPSCASDPYLKSTVTNLGLIVDFDFKFDMQAGAVVQKSFLYLRQIAKLKPVLTQKYFTKMIHAFITTRLDYCNAHLGIDRLHFLAYS